MLREEYCFKKSNCVRRIFMLPHTTLLVGYLLLTGLAAAAAAFSSARSVRVFSRIAIFCLRSLLKRAVSPQVFDI